LNAAKTEVIWFGSKRLSVRDKAVVIANKTLLPVDSVRNLGVYLDSELSMRAHITKTTQACFFKLRRLRKIRCLLGRDDTASLVHTVAARLLQRAASSTSTVHHGAVAAGHECSSASRLQPLVTRDHVTPALIELHWLPITARVE